MHIPLKSKSQQTYETTNQIASPNLCRTQLEQHRALGRRVSWILGYKEPCNHHYFSILTDEPLILQSSDRQPQHPPPYLLPLSKMHLTTLIALALVPAGALAAPTPWAQAANGEWIANNTVYPRVGSRKSTSGVISRPDLTQSR